MITVILGSNSFLADKEIATRTKTFEKEHGNLAIERLDGEEASFEQMRASVESQPFLSVKKLVLLRSPGSNRQFAEQFDNFLDRVLQTTDVIIIEPKLDKRLSYYKTLKKQPNIIDCNKKEAKDLPVWLVELTKELGGSLSLRDARYLVERVGINQQLLHKEIEKLLLYNAVIDQTSIDLLTELTPQSTIFQLLETAFDGNSKWAIEIYEEQRLQKVEPIAIIGMLAWQLHIIAVVKTAGSRNAITIADEAHLSPYVVQKTQNIARQMTLWQVKSLIAEVMTLDARLKSINIDADDALKQLLIDIARLSHSSIAPGHT